MFENALNILQKANERAYLSISYLNLSALYSQISQHKKGLKYARMALLESQHDFLEKEQAKTLEDEEINTLIISYHNIAVEEEYFKNYEEALLHYENSVNIAQEYLG